jgi:hypothetical protein
MSGKSKSKKKKDYETLDDKESFEDSDNMDDENPEKEDKDDLLHMGWNFLKLINFKIGFLLFLIGIFILSDIFSDKVLSLFSDTTHGECATTKGTMIQLIFLVIAYILLDLLDKADII